MHSTTTPSLSECTEWRVSTHIDCKGYIKQAIHQPRWFNGYSIHSESGREVGGSNEPSESQQRLERWSWLLSCLMLRI